jgi:hypothetical protein
MTDLPARESMEFGIVIMGASPDSFPLLSGLGGEG